MATRRQTLGYLIKAQREHKEITQQDVADKCGIGISRTTVAHLEQARKLPRPEIISAICSYLDLPESHWLPFTQEESQVRFNFEEILSELVGIPVSLEMHDRTAQKTAENVISEIFSTSPTPSNLLDSFNSILVYYGVGPVSRAFFYYYFDPSAFGSLQAFSKAVEVYQMDAIRLFSTFSEAFERLNIAGSVEDVLRPIHPHDVSEYQARTEWTLIETIDGDSLPDLGYISAQRVRQEEKERQWLIDQLRSLASSMGNDVDSTAQSLSNKNRRKIDSLLRKFGSTILHGVSSPLFQPDKGALLPEADRLAPKNEEELARMSSTQEKASRNLSRYLAADHMDVYVATSMRTSPDFVSVNNFVNNLFAHEGIRPLKLRYFNPTQSWVDDRVAKGLVEALMLKRASVTIYMAQKTDTFGKDSEASVALGQGKPVIVYVPKLQITETIDSENFFDMSRGEITQRYNSLPGEDSADDTMDDESLIAGILKHSLEEQADDVIIEVVRKYWADFDLYGESDRFDGVLREEYRGCLDEIISGYSVEKLPPDIRTPLIGALVATTINFEKRAKVFREVHPLALQVILSTGVLNGILVARTCDQCAKVLEAVIRNKLDLEIQKDDDNYRVVERLTGSTIRVISRHKLLRNAFEAYYRMKRSLISVKI